MPLYDKIVVLQTQVVELATERLQLFRENTTLKDKLDKRAKTEFRDLYYYQEGDQTPLCPNCFDTSAGDLRVHCHLRPLTAVVLEGCAGIAKS